MYLLMSKFLVGDLSDLIANKTSWISKIYINGKRWSSNGLDLL